MNKILGIVKKKIESKAGNILILLQIHDSSTSVNNTGHPYLKKKLVEFEKVQVREKRVTQEDK